MKRVVTVLVLLIVGLLFSAGATVLAAEQGNCVLKIIAGNELAQSATVYLDGRAMGTLGREMSISNLKPGEYSLVFDGDTLERHERIINFDFDYEMVETTFIADRATRVLDIQSDPSDARIWIDGKLVECRTSCEVSVEVEKAYEIELWLQEHEVVTRIVNVPAKGVPITINIIIPTIETLVTTFHVEMIYVEGGAFMMGDEFGDLPERYRPVHQVKLTYAFYMGKYPITFDEYDAFCKDTGRMKPSDWGWGRGQRPVINVSWWDAIAYCNWLSEKEGLPVAYRLRGEPDEGQMLDAHGNVTTDITEVVGYRLPTVAEWEYAARGGRHHSPYRYSGSDNVDEVAWYWRNSGDEYLTGDWDRDRIDANNCRTQEVGTKLANELGIHDMSGNVWEWCSDSYYIHTAEAKTNPYIGSGFSRVIRGGSWDSDASSVRVAYRLYNCPTNANGYVGFRITRTVQ